MAYEEILPVVFPTQNLLCNVTASKHAICCSYRYATSSHTKFHQSICVSLWKYLLEEKLRTITTILDVQEHQGTEVKYAFLTTKLPKCQFYHLKSVSFATVVRWCCENLNIYDVVKLHPCCFKFFLSTFFKLFQLMLCFNHGMLWKQKFCLNFFLKILKSFATHVMLRLRLGNICDVVKTEPYPCCFKV